MRRFFDTNILVYAHDVRDPGKRELSRAIVADAMASDDFVVSTQVLAEFYATATRRRVLAPAEARDLVLLWSEHDTVLQTPGLILRGILLHQEQSVSFWDALIVQAAIEARCDVLLSEDLQHGRRFGDVEIANPYLPAHGAHEPGSSAYMPSGKSTSPRRGRPRRKSRY